MRNIVGTIQLIFLAIYLLGFAIFSPRLEIALPATLLLLIVVFGTYNRKWWQRRL
jgi:hypothetical protein